MKADPARTDGSTASSWWVFSLALACATGSTAAHAADPGAPSAAGAKAGADSGLSCGALWCRAYPRPADAFAAVLAERPRILGVGELHETNGAPAARSALAWFTEALLPRLAGHASDLVAETWIAEGSCGATESKAVEAIGETIERPERTEDELVSLLRRSKGLGIRPHILQVGCDDYRRLLDERQELDPEELLTLVARLLREKVAALHRANEARGAKRTVVIYGGAVHNDVAPADELAAYSFGPALSALEGARYVELDLYVPELLAADEALQSEPWYPIALRAASPTRALLFRPRPASWVLVLPSKAKPR